MAALSRALRQHWPEYLIEAWGLGTFMVSAGVFATLLWSPGSSLSHTITAGGDDGCSWASRWV